jgi:hypothetical protein
MAWKDLNLRTRRVRFNDATMAGPPNQNPKGRRLILVSGVAKARPGDCYPRYLGITRRSCLEAHMVLDMEYREQRAT